MFINSFILDISSPLLLRGVTGQNGSGQNGTDKMSLDKMVWTKWYRQNGTDKMVASFGIDSN